ncbi:hypothetical protein [Kitasatospora cathayae]|uniref:DUF732 domain-containing protein n=1 Tax=Kitasatospora cathayae TaxID=3004092 RepID=A0ABY7QHP5_9ACTN|nr:hypothetical protein [Kitasatospora sp. HUAS 3-15]WBP92077.1 hypothetical protein O1G21_40815 [Kitasatospora sp. HUAS 3-15]
MTRHHLAAGVVAVAVASGAALALAPAAQAAEAPGLPVPACAADLKAALDSNAAALDADSVGDTADARTHNLRTLVILAGARLDCFCQPAQVHADIIAAATDGVHAAVSNAIGDSAAALNSEDSVAAELTDALEVVAYAEV